MLLNINIKKLKNMIILISKQRFFVDNYIDFSTSINVVDVEKRVDRVIRNKLILLLFSHFVTNCYNIKQRQIKRINFSKVTNSSINILSFDIN